MRSGFIEGVLNMRLTFWRKTGTLLAVAVIALAFANCAAAQSQIQGVITGRNGANMTVQTQEMGNVVVTLSDNTQVIEPEGLFRKKHLELTALIPGLPVKVKGSYNGQNQLVADSVEFKGSDLENAEDMQASQDPTKQQQQLLKEQQQKQEAQLQAEKVKSTENAERIAKNKALIAEANKRFGELGEYNILGEATVYFANGSSTTVEPQYKQELQKLSQQAKGITAYILLVQGYASKVGSAALNQRLSSERAENVTVYLEQDCQIPLTNML